VSTTASASCWAGSVMPSPRGCEPGPPPTRWRILLPAPTGARSDVHLGLILEGAHVRSSRPPERRHGWRLRPPSARRRYGLDSQPFLDVADQYVGLHRLGEIGMTTATDLLLFDDGGQEDDRDALQLRIFTEILGDGATIRVRHDDVQNDEIGSEVPGYLDGLRPPVLRPHLIPTPAVEKEPAYE